MQNEGNYNDNPNVAGFALPPALDGWVVLDKIFLKFLCWRITKKIVKVKIKLKWDLLYQMLKFIIKPL